MAAKHCNRFSCDECNLTYKTKASLWTHKQTIHEGKLFRCGKCSYSANYSGGLDRHKDTFHDGIIHKCQECDKVYTQKSSLGVHRRVSHGGLLHNCEYCSHKARNKAELLRHKAFVHLEGNVTKCQICDRKFNRSTHLKVHMRSHTGEKPFGCAHCPERFGHKNRMKSHEQNHAVDPPSEKPLVCLECRKCFTSPLYLKHQPQAYCNNCVKSFKMHSGLTKSKIQNAERDLINTKTRGLSDFVGKGTQIATIKEKVLALEKDRSRNDTDNYHCSILDCDFVSIGQNDQMLKEHASMLHSADVLFLTSTDMHHLLDAKILEVEERLLLFLKT